MSVKEKYELLTLISIRFGVLDVCRKLGEDVHTGGVGLGVFCTELDVPERDTKKATHGNSEIRHEGIFVLGQPLKLQTDSRKNIYFTVLKKLLGNLTNSNEDKKYIKNL